MNIAAEINLTDHIPRRKDLKIDKRRKRSMGNLDKVNKDFDPEKLIMLVAADQNRLAFRSLFDHFAPRLKSYLLNFKLSDQKAEDLVQETFMTVWQKASLFDPNKAKFSTWLFRIARNKYIDFTRKQKYPEISDDLLLNQIESDEKIDENVSDIQMEEIVETAMAKLKPDQQKVIKLSFYAGYSHSQISEQLKLPLGTVKSKIRTAFNHLRKDLGGHL